MSSGDGSTSAFTESSVLIDFVLLRTDANCYPLFDDHPCQPVASREVEKEVERVIKRRHILNSSMLEYARRDAFGEFEPPEDIRLSGNDDRYLIDAVADLRDAEEVVRRLNERKRRTGTGYEVLFSTPDPKVQLIHVSRDAHLLAFLKDLLNHDDDARVVADAADWAADGGSGILLTEDREEMLDIEEDINDHVYRHLDVELTIQRPLDFLSS